MLEIYLINYLVCDVDEWTVREHYVAFISFYGIFYYHLLPIKYSLPSQVSNYVEQNIMRKLRSRS